MNLFYVDDIFIAAPTENNSILETFNSLHERLQFTLKASNKDSLNVTTLIDSYRIIFSYNKPTFSGKYSLQFLLPMPNTLSHKRSIIFGLVYRILLFITISFPEESGSHYNITQ